MQHQLVPQTALIPNQPNSDLLGLQELTQSSHLSALQESAHLSALQESSHLSALQESSTTESLTQLPHLSVAQLSDLSALSQERRSNFPEKSVESQFLQTCQQAFLSQQNIQSSTEHNEAGTSESVFYLPINLPIMGGDEIDFEVASKNKILAEHGEFSANVAGNKECSSFVWHPG